MDVKQIYERITLNTPIDVHTFLFYYNDTVQELVNRYGECFILNTHGMFTPIEDINAAGDHVQDFSSAIADNIMYLVSGDEKYKTYYITKADEAYKKIWTNRVKNKRIKKDCWS